MVATVPYLQHSARCRYLPGIQRRTNCDRAYYWLCPSVRLNVQRKGHPHTGCVLYRYRAIVLSRKRGDARGIEYFQGCSRDIMSGEKVEVINIGRQDSSLGKTRERQPRTVLLLHGPTSNLFGGMTARLAALKNPSKLICVYLVRLFRTQSCILRHAHIG